ncbi:GAF and ANTAR domain-containing protein [Actinomycetospora lemnae]|uniref:GAF and ANTAR domain-containing protein n=1 Tax=Actinomycetospora lemnae TaxID=3019891 RepID=A0ABT5SRE0_9PSEU|nr:GAF and ANTAR domain-containing protein [Actinomycetospora sp. DW7H6]MDD7965407.1 GAF and ANTAR domain-containing protein [Actinomycetospora sp. DW7H6]
MTNSREPQVIDTFLTLTDTLTRDFDALDMLTTLCESCVDLLDVSAAGVILSDGQGGLSVAAASSERSRLLGVFAVAIDAGPCVECVRTGRPVISEDLTDATAARMWPRYATGAQEAGFRATHALPMRLRDEVIGVLTLLHTDRHVMAEGDARLGQALADAASIGLLHERALRRAEAVQEQLQGALNSRVIIEQAKGVLAGRGDLSPEDAFTALRSHARARGLRLTELARDVVQGTVDVAGIVPRTR